MPIVTETLGISLPIIAAQTIFSSRRAKRGIDNMEENPVFGIMNLDIAGGQIVKGVMAAKAISDVANASAVSNIVRTTTKAASTGIFTKILGGAKKVLFFTAEHINPVIWVAGLAKVLFGKSDDKLEDFDREILSIGTMRIFEESYKKVVGMPSLVREGERMVAKTAKPAEFMQKLFSTKQAKAVSDFLSTKRTILNHTFTLKSVPPVLQGVCFVGMSILGYYVGTKIGDAIFGKKNEKFNARANV